MPDLCDRPSLTGCRWPGRAKKLSDYTQNGFCQSKLTSLFSRKTPLRVFKSSLSLVRGLSPNRFIFLTKKCLLILPGLRGFLYFTPFQLFSHPNSLDILVNVVLVKLRIKPCQPINGLLSVSALPEGVHFILLLILRDHSLFNARFLTWNVVLVYVITQSIILLYVVSGVLQHGMFLLPLGSLTGEKLFYLEKDGFWLW